MNLVSSEHEKYIFGSFFHQHVFSSTNLLLIVNFVPYDRGPYNRGVWFNL